MALAALIPMALAVAGLALGDRRAARAIGRPPDAFGRGHGVPDFLGRVHRGVLAMSLAGLLLGSRSAGAARRGILAAIPGWRGVLLVAAGAALVLAAQRAMGAAWRIGIDAAPTPLVAEGLFPFSRNPTFLGMVTMLLGATLTAPNLLTAVAPGAGFVAFPVQIRPEEAHLSALNGQAYRDHAARVPRWFGRRP